MRISKTQFIVVIAILFLVVGGIGFYAYHQYRNSFYNLTITNPEGISLSFYRVYTNESEDGHDHDESEHHEIKRFSEKVIQQEAQRGDYCIKIHDQKYDQTETCFKVTDKDESITINPSFSESYLNGILTKELQAQLEKIISTQYAPIIDKYILKRGELLNRGEWYSATLTTIILPRDTGDVYRLLLHKESSEWKIIAHPQLYLSKYDYPDIPVSVLEATNDLLGSS